MAFDTINTAPAPSDFTPLSEHESQTPGSFFGGKPVLHSHVSQCTLRLPRDQFEAQPHIKRLSSDAGSGNDHDNLVEINEIETWITSRNVILFSPAQSFGLQIRYPTISVTAQDRSDVLLELNLSDANTADEDIEFMQLRIVPGTVQNHDPPAKTNGHEASSLNGTANESENSAKALFRAISDCQELNPDPPGDDEDEDFDETAPGATGWITSENMADFMDEHGEFRMPPGMTVIGDDVDGEGESSLGGGAGRVRTVDELDDGRDGEDDEDNKWQRTS